VALAGFEPATKKINWVMILVLRVERIGI